MIKRIGQFKADMDNFDKAVIKRLMEMFEWEFTIEAVSDGTFNVFKTVYNNEEPNPEDEPYNGEDEPTNGEEDTSNNEDETGGVDNDE